MSQDLLNKVNDKLNEKFPGSVVSAELLYDYPVFTIKTSEIHDVLKFLKEDEELNFIFYRFSFSLPFVDSWQFK